MQFEFKGQTYEVDEDNVMFSINKDGCINCLDFRKPVKVKPRWHVSLTTCHSCTCATEVLFESGDYNACCSVFDQEKDRLVKELMIRTKDAYRLEVSSSAFPSWSFNVIDLNHDIKYYLRLVKD